MARTREKGGKRGPREVPATVPSAVRPASLAPLLSLLLAASGFCALVYETVWLRDFRLIFGAATPATAAVLAVFMGGLGAGSLLFGRLAERTSRPLRAYARLELAVALSVFVTPWILELVAGAYRRSGGSIALGDPAATVLRIALSFVVLAVPCTLMGGTMPLVAKAVETDEDLARGTTGLLYGSNALGGLAGVVASTFFLLERLGNHGTLRLACAANLAVALVALRAASRRPVEAMDPAREAAAKPPASRESASAPAPWIYAAAFTTGFVFFLAELVWYRMTTPLLGGSVYGFGLVLSFALAGIGLGGVLYRAFYSSRSRRPMPADFALVSLLQALVLVLPFAFGDRIAPYAFHANALRADGLFALVCGWSALVAPIVLPASVLAGLQFPLLVALLGRGRDEVGRQLGWALAANTLGSIAGSLLGGFVAVPALGAPGCWRLAVALTLALGASAAAWAAVRRDASARRLAAGVAAGVAAAFLLATATGPTAAWRHVPYGYGRVTSIPRGTNEMREWIRQVRWETRKEFDGRESSVAVLAADDLSFVIGGKSDGAAVADAATQVMCGLVGATLHPAPRTALVIGLGTGSSVGWLADYPGIERVDAVEIEPGILGLAADDFASINRDVMRNPKAHVVVGDARETLSVDGPSYDLVLSEPSNPYRAGISSLYTREYYQAVLARLNPGGLFSQWVQGYEIDTRTMLIILRTLLSVFPWCETWATQPNDLLLVCGADPPTYTMASIRERIREPVLREALRVAWNTDSAEGFLVRHFASAAMTRQLAQRGEAVNTDDSNLLEYGFAKALAAHVPVTAVNELLAASVAAGEDRPERLRDEYPERVAGEQRLLMLAADEVPIRIPPDLAGPERDRAAAVAAYVDGDYRTTLRLWRGEPREVMEKQILVEATAIAGRPEEAWMMIDGVRADWPAEAHVASGVVAARVGNREAAVRELAQGFVALRRDPWVPHRLLQQALLIAADLAPRIPEADARELFESISARFALSVQDEQRLAVMVQISKVLPVEEQRRAIDAWGGLPPWSRGFLEFRRDALRAAGDPALADAERDLAEFLAAEPDGSRPADPSPPAAQRPPSAAP